MLAHALQLREAGQDKEALAVILNHLGYTQRNGFVTTNATGCEITPPGSGKGTPRSRPDTPHGEHDESSVACQTQLALLGVELCNQLADRCLAVKMGAQALDHCTTGEGLCDGVWRLRCGGPWWKDERWAAARCRCLFNAAEGIKASSKIKKEPDVSELREVLRRLNECEEIQQMWPSCVEQPESLQLCLAETRWRLGNYKAAGISCQQALATLGAKARLGASGAHAVMLALWISANIAFETGRHDKVAETVHQARSVSRDCPDEAVKFRLGRILTRIERLGRQAVLAQTDGTCAMASACISPKCAPVGSGVSAVRRQRSTQEINKQAREASGSPTPAPRAQSSAPAPNVRDRSVSPRCGSTPSLSPRATPRSSANLGQRRFKDASVSPRCRSPSTQRHFKDAAVSPGCTPSVSPRTTPCQTSSKQKHFRDSSVSPRTPSISPRAAPRQTCPSFRDASVSPRRPSPRTTRNESLRAATQEVGTQASMHLIEDEADVIQDFLANQEEIAIETFLAGGRTEWEQSGNQDVPARAEEDEDAWEVFATAMQLPKAMPSKGRSAPRRRPSVPLPRQQSSTPPRQTLGLSPRRPITPPRRSPKPPRPGRSWSPGVWGGMDSEASTELPGLSHNTSSSSLPRVGDSRADSCRSETPLSALGIDLTQATLGPLSRSRSPSSHVANSQVHPESRPRSLQMARSRSNTPPTGNRRRQDVTETGRYECASLRPTPNGPPAGLLEDLQDFLKTYGDEVAEPEPAPQQTPVSTWDAHRETNATENLLHEVLEELCNQPTRTLPGEVRFQSSRKLDSPCHAPAPDHSQIPDTIIAKTRLPRVEVGHGVAEGRVCEEAPSPKTQLPTSTLSEPVLCLPQASNLSQFPTAESEPVFCLPPMSDSSSSAYAVAGPPKVSSPERQIPACTMSEPAFCVEPSADVPRRGDDEVTCPSTFQSFQVVFPPNLPQDAALDPVLYSPTGPDSHSKSPEAILNSDSEVRAPLTNAADSMNPGLAECTLCQSAPAQTGLEWCAQCGVLQVICPLCKRSLSFGEMHVHLLSCRPGAGAVDEMLSTSFATDGEATAVRSAMVEPLNTKSGSSSAPRPPRPAAPPQPQHVSNPQSQPLQPVARGDGTSSKKSGSTTENPRHADNPVPEYLRRQMSPNPSGEQLIVGPASPKKDAKPKTKRPRTPQMRPPPLISPTRSHASVSAPEPKNRQERTDVSVGKHEPMRSASASPSKSNSKQERAGVSVVKHESRASQSPTPPPVPTAPPPPPSSQSPTRVAPWRPAGGPEQVLEREVEPAPVVEVLHKRLKDAQVAAEDSQQPRGPLAWAYRGVRSQVTPPHLVRGIFNSKAGSRKSSPRNAGPVPSATSPH